MPASRTRTARSKARTAISSGRSRTRCCCAASRDFDDLAAYRGFIDEIVGRRNARNAKRIDVERAALQQLPARRTLRLRGGRSSRVTSSGGFTLRKVFYTVPSRLIGHRLRVRLYDDRLEVFIGGTHLMTLPRGRAHPNGKHDQVVDYRHVIHFAAPQADGAAQPRLSRPALPARGLPPDLRRRSWNALPERQACRAMVDLLALAHDRGCEAELAAQLAADLQSRPACPTWRLCGSASRPIPRICRTSSCTSLRSLPTRALIGAAQIGRRSMKTSHRCRHRPPRSAAQRAAPAHHQAVWPQFAEQADKEGWPAARFLAAIAEHELAERGRRRIERHLAEARLPPGKTLDTFDFDAVPMISKAQVMALAAGDSWLEQGRQSAAVRPARRRQEPLAAAIGLALIENGWRVLFTRTTDLVQKLQVARRELDLEPPSPARPLRPADPRRPRLRHQGPGRDQRAVRADQRPLRAAIDAHHRQPAVRRMGQDLPRSRHDAGRHRPPRPPRHDLRDERRELSPARRHRTKTRSGPAADTRDTQNIAAD